MIKGVTESGFAFEIDENSLQDWRLIRAISEAESDDESEMLKGSVDMVRILMGKAGEKKLLQHVMERNGGYAPTSAVLGEVTEIFRKCKSLKNS